MGLIRAAAVALAALLALPAGADVPGPADGSVRVATYAPALTRRGPGLLLRDIRSGKDDQIAAAAQVIVAARADVIVLTSFDWDHDGLALDAFAALLADQGLDYPHRFAGPPNSGLATGIDMDGDGRSGRPDDAQGFGQFRGAGGMAVLSRLPLGAVTDYSAVLWRNLPGNLMPDDTPPQVAQVQRLSSTAHWDVPVQTGAGVLHLLAWSATPPVFGRDGGERNARRNHDEAMFWLHHLPDAPFVLAGNANLDPNDGNGRHEAIRALIAAAQDPQPRGNWPVPQGPHDEGHSGDPALDTAWWPDRAPGNLRVSYVLPARGVEVAAAGVVWPDPDTPLGAAVAAVSAHRLVWVELRLGVE
ncbi:MAG: endonuclease/exonuclease/phosphatase family protein [Paracoccus sp. (in: a-proteobacteria)]|uniref:endonuclease/exonuclease/phosphatase family protein n=1 Tax=Paracoccus sp. TaxID=267 RepID=UPI0026E11323|nr:endonuclease/exonuclease/phosphatase family protein [Paracoccus sp. (in: a-proteobacteria)]MDO5632577.1 endonuclease/exonuclease/phosphatase family protein [Paracoccus sp. (in: a-proteobacteria)]